MTQNTISVLDSKTLLSLFGPRDQHLRKIRSALGVQISARDGRIRIEGDEPAVRQATSVFEQLRAVADKTGDVAEQDVELALSNVTGDEGTADRPTIGVLQAGRQVRPRTPGQAEYVSAIAEHDLILCVGPAGTGKTYLAVAMAAAALKQERIRKIVLVRPAVEAGESLGYLPGDLQAKINPYLRPLLDALREMMDYDQIRRLHRARRDRDDSAGLHARADVERRVHHSRRSAKHDRGANEDVFDPDGDEFENCRFGRHDAGRFAAARARAVWWMRCGGWKESRELARCD